MSTDFKFPKSKTIHEAILEIAVDTHTPLSPYWRIFLPVCNRPSIMASWIVLHFVNLNSVDIPITNFQVKICWTFFPSELPLPSWVLVKLQSYLYVVPSSFLFQGDLSQTNPFSLRFPFLICISTPMVKCQLLEIDLNSFL